MDQEKNYYEILHVQQDAPTEVIRATYRTMMQKMKMHPDLGGNHSCAALINDAYAVLMDPVARAKYDESLKVPQGNQASADQQPSSNTTAKKVIKKVFDLSLCAFCDLPHQLGHSVTIDSVCTRCGSALYPAEKQVLEQDGQRVIQRIEKQWPVSFYLQWPITRGYLGNSQDVSLNGIQMQSHTFLKEGQVLKLSSHMLDAVAVVVNVRNDHTILRKRWRVGLQFITLKFHRTQGTFLKINA